MAPAETQRIVIEGDRMKRGMKKRAAVFGIVCIMCVANIREVSTISAAEGVTRPDADAVAARDSKPIKIEKADEPALVLGSLKITLGQAIEWAVKQNFDLLSVSYDVAMVDTMYNQFQKKFAPVLSLEGGGSYMHTIPSQKGTVGHDVTQVKMGANIYKNFSSGTTIIAGLSHEYDDFDRSRTSSLFSTLYGPANPHRPNVFVSIQQELLKNAFGYNDRKTEQILKNVTKMQKEGMILKLSIVIVQVIGEYWTVVMDKVSLENADLQVRETRKVRDITARNAAYGLADDFTLNFYNALLAGAEAKVTMARQKYHQSLRGFLTTINVDENTDVTGTAVFSDKYPVINIEEALKTAYVRRADYQNALLSLENAKMGVQIATNGQLPSLVAEINGMLQGENDKIVTSYGNIGSFKYPAIEGKLKLMYPIADKDAATKARNARFQLRQAEIQLQKYRRNVKDDIMNATENIESMYRLHQKATEGRRQSELFYYGMLKNLKMGKLSASIVKNGLDALVQSREMELQALVGYNIALLMFDVARNELFTRYRIDVDKYIPKDRPVKIN